MKIEDLYPNPKNPRKISDAQLERLKKSLDTFGDLSGIVFNEVTARLAGGHQRIKCLPKDAMINITKKYDEPTKQGTVALGHIKIDGELFSYRQVRWDEPTELAANVAANKHGGEWGDNLADILLEIDAANIDLNLTGFSEEELKNIMAPVSFGGQCDEDEVPEKVEPKTKLGDLYKLGNHRLLCGDSTDILQVEKLMAGEKADLLITDPPYGVSYIEKNAAVHGGMVKNNIGKEIKNDTGTVEEMGVLWAHLFSHADHFSDEASYYVFSPQGGELMMMMQAIHQSKWQLKHSLIWKKQNFVFGRCDYHYQHEPVLYGWKKKGKHNWYSDRSQSSILEFDKPHKSDLHPTTKPVDIIEYLIGNSSKQNDKVVDLFGGSGSTLIACEKTNRKCFMMELDPHYCDVIVARWEKYTGKKAELITGP